MAILALNVSGYSVWMMSRLSEHSQAAADPAVFHHKMCPL